MSGDAGHDDEQAAQLLIAPAPAQQAPHQQHQGHQHVQQDQPVPPVELVFVQLAAVEGVHAGVARHHRQLGALAHLPGVEHHISDGDAHEEHKAHRPEAQPGIELHPGDGLGHRHGVGVQGGGHEAHELAQGHDGKAGHGVVAQGDHQPHDQRVEAVELAEHPEHRAADAEDEHEHRDEDQVPAAQLLHHPADARVEGPGLDHHAEGGRAGQDHKDDVRRAHAAGVEGGEQPQEAGGHRLGLVDELEGAGHRHLPGRAVHVDGLVLVGAGGDDPGQHRRQHDDAEHHQPGVHPLPLFLVRCFGRHNLVFLPWKDSFAAGRPRRYAGLIVASRPADCKNRRRFCPAAPPKNSRAPARGQLGRGRGPLEENGDQAKGFSVG